MTPGTLNITVLRNVPFLDTIRFVGLDFTGATFAMQVRLRRGAAGDPLLSLTGATAGSQGLSNVLTEEDGIDVSTVTIQIDEATVDALLPATTNGLPAGSDVVLYYDLVIDGGGVGKQRWVEGTFTIHEGVTV